MIENKQVEGYITRSYMLYKTEVEYGDWAMNHVKGCAHACDYCYACGNAKRRGRVSDMKEWSGPWLVSNTLELLKKEIPKLQKETAPRVFLSFTTDPFMYGYPEIKQMSLAAIRMLNEAGIPCTVLSKGVLPMELACLSPQNEYGITLSSLDENFREIMEPGSAPYAERIGALRRLHEAQCHTFISVEPFFTPNIHNQNLQELFKAVDFVDKIIFGRVNRYKGTAAYPDYKGYYNHMAAASIKFGEEHGMQVYIKEGTFTPRGKMCHIV